MSLAWDQRAREVAYLLNPAFCGEVIRRCIETYQQTAQQSMPVPLLFLILPIVLHRSTRETMPRTARGHMYSWLQENPHVKVGFVQRARNLLRVSREAQAFLMQFNALTVDGQAGLAVARRRRIRIPELEQGEVLDCFKKAELLGKWFASGGSSITIYTMWGVRP